MQEILISLKQQTLALIVANDLRASYQISSSPLGTGYANGSNQTPAGKFLIIEKIGHGMPAATVFKGRMPTQLPYDTNSTDDQVTSRILRLHGLQQANSNTLERYIYIHGTNHPQLLGSLAGHGCIRMHPSDIVELFPQVTVGTKVTIA